MIGDFNIRYPKIIEKIVSDEYTSSIEIKKYISYPPSKYTLDYILLPKKFKFKSFSCLETKISDHKALLVEIIL